MGLDITAVAGLQRAACGTPTEGPCEIHIRFRFSPHEAGLAGSLEEGVCYEAECGETYRIGNYRWYGRWHESLSALASLLVGTGHVGTTRWPFAELVDFAEVQGVFGPEASARLAEDFHRWDQQAGRHFSEVGYETYQDWCRAFTLAGESGAVLVW